MDRLSAEDRLVLWTDDIWPQDVGLVGILEGGPLLDPEGRLDLTAVRAAVARRLHLLPRLRQVLRMPRRGLGWPYWVDAASFDVADHVDVVGVPAPGGDAEFLHTVELLRRRRLDPDRPLWEMWLLLGLADQGVGLFVRVHHVVADGIAGLAGLAALLDAERDPGPGPAPPPWRPRPEPSNCDLLLDNLRRRECRLEQSLRRAAQPGEVARRAAAAWPALRELLAGEPGPRTSLGGLIGPRRELALVRCDLQVVAGVAHRHDATVNDVLLAVIAGAVRALLRSRGEAVPEELTLPIYVPMSLRAGGAGATEMGNEISQLIVPLPVGMTDPVARLRRITAETRARKAVHRPSLGAVFQGRVVGALALRRIVRQRVNLLSADLPGPTGPWYFAGARLLEAAPLLNLLGNVTLGIGGLSYCERFDLLVEGDAEICPDAAVLAEACGAELGTLAASSAPEVLRA